MYDVRIKERRQSMVERCFQVSVSDSCDDQVSITTVDSQPSRVECSVTSSFDETSPRLNVLESSLEESETNLNLLPGKPLLLNIMPLNVHAYNYVFHFKTHEIISFSRFN